MAEIWLGYPIASATGRFGGGMFRKGSTQLLPPPPRRPPKKSRGGCECNAWKYADRLWAAGLIKTDPWRHALKKPGISGYDLWMKEAVHVACRGHYYPDFPSISGGFSPDKTKPGTNWQPPACCVKDYVRTWAQWVRYKTKTHDAMTVELRGYDPRDPKYRIVQCRITMYGEGWDHGPTWSRTVGTPYNRYNMYVRNTWQKLWEIQVTALDGTYIVKWARETAYVRPPRTGTQGTSAFKHRGNWPSKCTLGKESR